MYIENVKKNNAVPKTPMKFVNKLIDKWIEHAPTNLHVFDLNANLRPSKSNTRSLTFHRSFSSTGIGKKRLNITVLIFG